MDLVSSRWLDIGQVLFLRCNGPRRKKKTRPTSSYLDKESSVIKDLLYGQNENSFAKLTREILSGQDRPILPARVANQNSDFIHLARSRIQPYNQDFSLGTTKTFKMG